MIAKQRTLGLFTFGVFCSSKGVLFPQRFSRTPITLLGAMASLEERPSAGTESSRLPHRKDAEGVGPRLFSEGELTVERGWGGAEQPISALATGCRVCTRG